MKKKQTKLKLTIVLFSFSILCIMACGHHTKNTALHESIINDSNEEIKKIISEQKDLDVYNNLGRTSLHLAILRNNKEIVEELILLQHWGQ